MDFEELEGAEERTLPEAFEFGVFLPAPMGSRGSGRNDAQAVESRLGPDWRLDRPSAGSRKFVLKGPGSPLRGGPSAESVRALLRDLPQVFGDAGSQGRLEVVFDRSGAPSGTVRFRQLLDGARVFGGDVVAHFDPQGRLRSISSSYEPDLRPENTRSITLGEATAIARRALEAAQPGIEIVSEGYPQAWLWPLNGAHRHVWLVRHATRHPLGSFVTRVDAATGDILALENRVQRAAKRGVGTVFKTNASYPRTSIVKLPGLFGVDSNPDGFLVGQRFGIFDALDSPAASPNLRFVYDPFSDLEEDSFDQVSAYYHLETAHTRFAHGLHVGGIPYFDGPTIGVVVNDTEIECNAFYAPFLFSDGSPGLLFGNQSTCPFPNIDFTRDSDIIHHEYTHAVVDWSGSDLGSGPENSYQSAINEAVADYHAANFDRDPIVGEVFGYGGRDLDNAKLYPDDVGCDNGQIEDHCTGEIWGGFLWDYQTVLKKKAEKLEFSSLDYIQDNWPGGHVPEVIDFWDAALGLLEADQTLCRAHLRRSHLPRSL